MSKLKKSKINISNLGGWHFDPNIYKKYAIQWPCGSIFASEGKRLYDLVKEKNPELIIEVGGYYGCSTTWMALALKENKKGKIISIDNGHLRGKWSMIPEGFEDQIELVNDDFMNYRVPKKIDMLFEDGMHTYGFTRKVIERFPAKTVVVHDYMHWDCQKTVKIEFDKAFGKPDEIFFNKGECGLAIKYR
jgi:hypothetical protein